MDREKVISALECCTHTENGCSKCPLKTDGRPVCEDFDIGYFLIPKSLVCDALKQLKEQEAVEPKQGEWIYCEDASGQDGYQCSECGFFEPWYYDFEFSNFITDYAYCPSCGKSMQEGRKIE